ncbi:unnamed protein product, partial [Agarophyton chilense]
AARVEPHTGVHFPATLSPTAHLLGLGARYMGGVVKVYAAGIYVHPTHARRALRAWRRFSAPELLRADPLWTVLCTHAAVPTVVRLVVARQVLGSHMQNGFERQLLHRVARAAKMGGACRPVECKAHAKRFCALFANVGTMKVGSDVRIALDDDLVTLTVDGRLLGEIRSKQLASSLLDMFLGPKAVVEGLRHDVANGLEHLLR